MYLCVAALELTELLFYSMVRKSQVCKQQYYTGFAYPSAVVTSAHSITSIEEAAIYGLVTVAIQSKGTYCLLVKLLPIACVVTQFA